MPDTEKRLQSGPMCVGFWNNESQLGHQGADPCAETRTSFRDVGTSVQVTELPDKLESSLVCSEEGVQACLFGMGVGNLCKEPGGKYFRLCEPWDAGNDRSGSSHGQRVSVLALVTSSSDPENPAGGHCRRTDLSCRGRRTWPSMSLMVPRAERADSRRLSYCRICFSDPRTQTCSPFKTKSFRTQGPRPASFLDPHPPVCSPGLHEILLVLEEIGHPCQSCR